MKSPKGDALDPKGLIADAYRMDGITAAECRSVFLDWALSFQGETGPALEALLARHGAPDHPMTSVIEEGRSAAARPRRRGGWRARPRD